MCIPNIVPEVKWLHCDKHDTDYPRNYSCPECDLEREKKRKAGIKRAQEENRKIRARIPKEITIPFGAKGKKFRLIQYYSQEGFVTDVTYRFKTDDLMDKRQLRKMERLRKKQLPKRKK